MDDWSRLLGGIRPTHRSLAKGEILFRAADPSLALHHLVRGRIRVTRPIAAGESVTVHAAGAGTLFAETALFSPHYRCDAIADRASEVRLYPKAAVLLHLSAHPDINLAFSAHLARQLQHLRGRVEVLRLKGAGERVLAHLAQLGAAEDAVTLDQPLTRLAGELGLTHEALYRTLARLQAGGRLARPGKRSFRLL
jgi:CRP-like cAMP-binding protein